MILASQIPDPSNADLNQELYAKLKAGDTAARDQLIEGNMALVIRKVDQFLAEYDHMEHLRQDLISEGFFALTEAVDQLKTKTDENITGFLSVSIWRELKDYMVKEAKHFTTPVDAFDLGYTPPETVGQFEELHLCCEDERDRQIIELKSQGYTETEIGQQLGCNQSTVNRAIQAIHKRYQERQA